MVHSRMNALFATFRATPSAETQNQLLTAIREYAIRATGNEDAAQDTVLAAWRQIERADWSPTKSFAQWLAGVISNHRSAIIRETIHQRHQVEFSDEDHTGEVDFSPVFEQWERDALAYETAARLPHDERRLADLILEGHSVKHAAKLARLTEGAARMRLRRAAKQLR